MGSNLWVPEIQIGDQRLRTAVVHGSGARSDHPSRRGVIWYSRACNKEEVGVAQPRLRGEPVLAV